MKTRHEQIEGLPSFVDGGQIQYTDCLGRKIGLRSVRSVAALGLKN